MTQAIVHPSEQLFQNFRLTDCSVSLDERMKKELFSETEVFIQKFGTLTPASQKYSLQELTHGMRANPSPALAALGKKVVHGLCHDQGVFLIKNVPIDIGEEATKTIYFILGSYLGFPTYNNRDRVIVWPVISRQIESSKKMEGNVRYGNTDGGLAFHTDTGTFAALLCVQQSEMGGENELISAVRVHNELRIRNPRCLEILYQPFHFDRRGEQLGDDKPYAHLPVFGRSSSGTLMALWAKRYILEAYQKYDIAPLSAEQTEALDLLSQVISEVAEKEAVVLKMAPGDILIVNNNLIYHNRRAFSGDRCAYRQWLFSPESESLPHMYGYPRYDEGLLGERLSRG